MSSLKTKVTRVQMRLLRILSVLLLLGGVGSLGFSRYIHSQVDEGKVKVKRAQKGVNAANFLFSTNETTAIVGEIATSPIQQKINERKHDIAYYENLANQCDLFGFVAIGAGAILLVASFVMKRRH